MPSKPTPTGEFFVIHCKNVEHSDVDFKVYPEFFKEPGPHQQSEEDIAASGILVRFHVECQIHPEAMPTIDWQ
jgi:hypothetical protein